MTFNYSCRLPEQHLAVVYLEGCLPRVAVHTFEQRYLTIKKFAVWGSEFGQEQVLSRNDLLTHTPSRCRLGNGSVGVKNPWAEIS